ncbi:hypothetical protein CAI21_02715 [Alkalilimnicola ehrlichii]|uniref:Response regulator receiver modulated diguanylate cyclase/phosphodiesterase with PAS/PAC sensor(S) n=1 Tax=Alkalilimnicola ehrlichii TaxID=351052 RepID=A0A3E0X209_9GAMM|nr:EAL domain-containing protein [Alkalilimnicola ehrlichii]RFA30908.1 hypothetical protein CAI21_02715 [Alkalilimnicola ehrlichii]RFA38859.1 hypothetical protein CAL65_02855 [Alkalilimnicola ehrlichii]
MGHQEDDILRLLIAEESLNDAEMLISVLRNAGHAVRATRIEDEEDLRQELDRKGFELFLYAVEFEGLPLESAQHIVHQSGKDIPILAVSDRDDNATRLEALKLGAADLISKHDLDHLQLVVARELKHLKDRRRLRRLEASLRETERRCYTLLDSSRDPIAYVHEGMHIYANPAYLEKFAYAELDDIEGMPLLDMVTPTYQAELKTFLRQYQKGKADNNELELSMQGPDQDPVAVRMAFSPASIDGEPCTQILLRDTGTVDRQLAEQLDTLSKQDVLTGLYNRTYFLEQLEKTIAQTLDGEGSHGLLYIHLDNLDRLRQSAGITAVDAAIGQFGQLVATEVGQEGVSARFADEVFTVLVADKGVHETIALAEAIRQRIEEHVAETNGRTVTTTCSIGISMLGDSGYSAHHTVNEAQQAAEAARAGGGNKVELYATGAEDGDGSDLRQHLRAAIDDGDFFLVYQPVASLKGDHRERYEVRVRLRGDNGNTIEPANFMPQAEELKLTADIDRWVAEHAIQTLAKRLAADHDTLLLVKISGATLADNKQFLKFVDQQLKRHGVSGQHLVFQINESVAVTQLNQAKETFRGLKALQCGFSLDRFGSGLNSFQLLKHLPADYLKLDRTLTQTLPDNEETQELVQQTIETAHSMNRKVIAGYLDDISSLAKIWQFDADFVQGDFLQEPETEMHYDFSGMVI